ncbi:uncharacterized protein KY384_003936 [Bacidia gigantensis]|uniref:uncharacterized protein n=1 Tax=Bacidia gigantensis TaxID=2732470 RepID=UPI001D053408|nr:uncharacterized protein KY384_003936 [Bacidia gigantensis]KAG8532295.1 hypothetical protein KY384_003936 [Bacidia gigantensis]
MRLSKASFWHVDIDKCLNVFVPQNFVHCLPRPIAHFLGYRETPQKELGNLLIAFWACVGAFVDVVLIESVFMIPQIRHEKPPLLIASFVCQILPFLPTYLNEQQGAAAILQYNTISSPLAQPRNAILGELLATITGIGITKVFLLSPKFEELRWLAGGLSVGAASAIMTVTKTIYPPAGATALLAAVDPTVQRLGWFLLPLAMLSTALTLVTSLLINNIQRTYPTYWWTPMEVIHGKRGTDIQAIAKEAPSSSGEASLEKERWPSHSESLDLQTIQITPERIVIPDDMMLTLEETDMLGILKNRLAQQRAGSETEGQSSV